MKDLVRKRVAFMTYCATVRHPSAVERVFPCALFAVASLLVFGVPVSTVFGQGTAFSYQGRLNDGGAPAAGNYDLRFTIYDWCG